MSTPDVLLKSTQPLRIVESTKVAGGLDPGRIGPVFRDLVPQLVEHIQHAGAQAGMLIGYYEEPSEDGSVGVHVGFEIGEQSVPAGDGIEITDLPVIEVASVIHRGGMEGITSVYEALLAWIEDSGFRLAGYSRELYHEMTADGPSVTEIQMPIAR